MGSEWGCGGGGDGEKSGSLTHVIVIQCSHLAEFVPVEIP